MDDVRPSSDPTTVNDAMWRAGRQLREYANRVLRPAEVTILLRYRDDLRGRVLEVGCGAGRLTGYLAEIAADMHAIDLSPAMVEHCRRAYPTVHAEVGDLSDLSSFADASFDAIVAPFCVVDVFGDDQRRDVLAELRRMVTPDGLLVLSGHNRGHAARVRTPASVLSREPRDTVARVVYLPRRLRNHRRLRDLQRHEPDYAIVNDEAHHYSLLHYYIDRDAQTRQLAEVGFEVLDCLDLDGAPVRRGDQAEHTPELHYVARPTPPAAGLS